jgi:hypothetical protein
VIQLFFSLSPELFTIVNNSLRRFVSGSLSKVLDENYRQIRDMLYSAHGGLSAPARIEKAKWLLSMHFSRDTNYSCDDVAFDELEELVRSFYARDYDLLYAELAAGGARRDDAA